MFGKDQGLYKRSNPLDFAREWSGKHRRRLTSDLDQALVLIGACVDGSGINASDTLKNENFKPHVALKSLLDWFNRNGTDQPTRNAASRAFRSTTHGQPARQRSPNRALSSRSTSYEAIARHRVAEARDQLDLG